MGLLGTSTLLVMDLVELDALAGALHARLVLDALLVAFHTRLVLDTLVVALHTRLVLDALLVAGASSINSPPRLLKNHDFTFSPILQPRHKN